MDALRLPGKDAAFPVLPKVVSRPHPDIDHLGSHTQRIAKQRVGVSDTTSARFGAHGSKDGEASIRRLVYPTRIKVVAG